MTATPSSKARREAFESWLDAYEKGRPYTWDEADLDAAHEAGAEWKGAQVEALVKAARALDDRFCSMKSSSALTLTDEFADFIDATRALGVESSDEGEAG
jgi:hypothetical protein